MYLICFSFFPNQNQLNHFLFMIFYVSPDEHSNNTHINCSFIGIEVLLEEGIYEAAYPLHDQLTSVEEAGKPKTWNDRMVNL